MWVADNFDARIYAYSITSGARDRDKEINTLADAGNGSPTGIWSDGTTMWVADDFDHKLYAYDMPSRNTATPAASAILSLTAGTGSFTITWTASSNDGGATVTAYDLRYIRSDAHDKADVNWTVVEDVWTTGSGALSHRVPGLAGGQRYDVQVRAIGGSNDGPWSAVRTVMTLVRGPASTDFNSDGRTDFIDFFLFADAVRRYRCPIRPRRQRQGGFCRLLQVCRFVRNVGKSQAGLDEPRLQQTEIGGGLSYTRQYIRSKIGTMPRVFGRASLLHYRHPNS